MVGGDEISRLRSQLEDQRQRLRELNQQSRVTQFQCFQYETLEETRRALSDQLMAEHTRHDNERREREALAGARISRLEQEIAALDAEVRNPGSAQPEIAAVEVERARAHAEQLTLALATARAEHEAEVLREQRVVQTILARLETEQRSLDATLAACAELETAIAAAVRPRGRER